MAGGGGGGEGEGEKQEQGRHPSGPTINGEEDEDVMFIAGIWLIGLKSDHCFALSVTHWPAFVRLSWYEIGGGCLFVTTAKQVNLVGLNQLTILSGQGHISEFIAQTR